MKLQKTWIFQKSANPHFPCKTAEGYIQHVLSHQAIKKDIVFCLAEENRDWQNPECQRFKESQHPAKGGKKKKCRRKVMFFKIVPGP